MKWFGHMEISANANERAMQCIRYVTSYADRPEREATVLMLLETLRKYELEDSVYEACFRSGIKAVIAWCALNCSETVIATTLNGIDQETLAMVINNRTLSVDFLEKLMSLADDSDRGIVNKKILKVRISAAKARNASI